MQTLPTPTPQQSQGQIKKKRSNSTQNAIAVKAILVECAKRPRSKSELVELTGLANCTISKYVNLLNRGPDNLLYIERYKRTKGPWTAYYALGFKAFNVPRPKALSNSEYCKLWRRNKKKASVTHTPTGIIHVSTS